MVGGKRNLGQQCVQPTPNPWDVLSYMELNPVGAVGGRVIACYLFSSSTEW